MNIKKKLMKLAGKEDFKLDSKITISYILMLCWNYGWMMIRGKLKSFAYPNISNSVFIGKKVKLFCKKKMKIGEKVKIKNYVKIDALSTNGVRIGNNCVLGENTKIECTGGLENIGKGVYIGNNTTFGSDCYFGAAGGITIGNDVIGGQYIRFHSENHKYSDLSRLIKDQGVTHKGIKIGNNCWIGAGVVFLDGAELGNGCVVGANAVVTGKFDENVVIGGIPAKVLKKRL